MLDVDNVQLRRKAEQLSPNEVCAELLALSVVEYSFVPDLSITIQLEELGGTISDTGRGMRLTPDPGDNLSHAERALTSVYPCLPASPEIEEILRELIWGTHGSLGPALANFACPLLQFISKQDGEIWSQSYRYGVRIDSAMKLGATDTTGTTVKFKTSAPIDHRAVADLVNMLTSRVPDLAPPTLHYYVLRPR